MSLPVWPHFSVPGDGLAFGGAGFGPGLVMPAI
jgi:hypothetical protein